MNLAFYSEPYVEPVHLEDAKVHLRGESSITAEDGAIQAWITAARQAAEAEANVRLVAQTLDLELPCFPAATAKNPDAAIELVTPLIAVVSITYTDENGVAQTLTSADYQVDDNARPPRLVPAYDEDWPDTRAVPAAVVVRFTCGFARPFTALASTGVCTAKGWTPVNGDRFRLWNSGGALAAGLSTLTDYYIVSASGSTFKLSLTSGGAAVSISANSVTYDFAGMIPGQILAGLKLILGDLSLYRENSISGAIIAEIPLAAKNLLRAERVWRF